MQRKRTHEQIIRDKSIHYSKMYNESNCYNIWSAYENPSNKKAAIWQDILRICVHMNGHGIHILGHTSYMFSAAFIFTDKEGKEMLHVIMPSKYFDVPYIKPGSIDNN